ncbi:DUF3042 family protein [Apilactobacillus sp. TMW 2.2459]|uniref:DUF3042 family protein n=1 Tax=Apilactobacillus xinyiensis TaxID=2841032 RepID=UPI00200F55AE|nr:DUF3042 family protein [Apilactobacillus xinyiensis]MCL0311785.1 DUF3042 family protein [Apilactobacillus xinyiensis]
MKKFGQGFLIGALATAGATVGALFSFKKTVVEPIENQEEKVEENRKRALRKQRSSHLQ